MKNTLQRRRSFSSLYFLVALVVCICLQIIVATVQPEGLLAVLASMFRAPGYISYPYNNSIQVTLLSSPAALYAGAVPNSFVLRAGDGAVVQKVSDNLFATYQGILYTDALTIDSQDGTQQVKAIRASDGQELWAYSSETLKDAQLIDGILYFNLLSPPQQETLQAHDPISGRLLWQYSCSIQGCSVAFPQVQQGIAYIVEQGGGNYNTLLALHTSDGKVLWRVAQYTYASQPLLTADRLLVRTASDTLTADSATDGRMLWQIHVVPGESFDTTGMISNGSIDLISTSNTLYAFNAESGALLWQRQDSPFGMRMNNTTIYLSEPAGLVALNATSGQQLWQQIYPSWAIQPANRRYSQQLNTFLGEANGKVYMSLKSFQNGYTTDGVFAYTTADGQLAWQRLFTLPTTPVGQSFVAGTDMEALFAGNTIYFTGYQVTTTIEYFHMTLSAYQTLNSLFNMTTFTLISEALDGQTGGVKWQNQQVEQFHVA